jgi:HPt (histidine-containing phosphotransfer) domain-containing protein
MFEQSAEVMARLQQLQNAFAEALPEKIASIETLWQQAQLEHSNIILLELHRQAHSLAGSAGTFQHPALSQQARQIELLIQSLLQEETWANNTDVISDISHAIQQLHRD